MGELNQYTEARTNYEESLAIAQKEGDVSRVGQVLGRLGRLAMQKGDLSEARKNLIAAIDSSRRIGERQNEADFLHTLGIVAQRTGDWDEAERFYRESLKIKESLGDLNGVAQTSHQLSKVAEHAGRIDEAERWYLRAIELKEKHSTPNSLALSLNNLASLYLDYNRIDEAEIYARRALELKETLDLSSEPWTTYSILAQIAEKRGHIDDVREWRKKERESFVAFPGTENEIKENQSLIAAVVAACHGNNAAKELLELLIQERSQANKSSEMLTVIRRIMDGERGDNLYDRLNNLTDALIVTRILQVLSEGTESSLASSQPSTANHQPQQQEQGVTLPQLIQLVERAAGGDKELGGQLFTAFQQMGRDENPAMSALGKVLLSVLVGERNPDLSQFPDEVASMIRGMLGRLKNK